VGMPFIFKSKPNEEADTYFHVDDYSLASWEDKVTVFLVVLFI